MSKHDELITAISSVLLVSGFILSMMPWIAICWRLELTWAYVWMGIAGLLMFMGVLAVAAFTDNV